MVDLKTTTRPRRHTAEFRELRRFLAAPPSGRPLEVANVGPGLAVRYFGRLSALEVPGAEIFRRIESGIRRIPMPDAFYENYETAELVATLGEMPFNLTLVDINPRVVRVVRQNTRGHKVDQVVVDLGEQRSVKLAPYRGKFDVVVAFEVIGRVRDKVRDNARENIRSLLRPGGILVGGGDIVTDDFTQISETHSVYQRRLAVSQGPA